MLTELWLEAGAADVAIWDDTRWDAEVGTKLEDCVAVGPWDAGVELGPKTLKK